MKSEYKKYLENVKNELLDCGKMSLFEIEIIETGSNVKDWIICNIHFDLEKNTIYEDYYNNEIVIDENQNLDYYIIGLYEMVQDCIFEDKKISLVLD